MVVMNTEKLIHRLELKVVYMQSNIYNFSQNLFFLLKVNFDVQDLFMCILYYVHLLDVTLLWKRSMSHAPFP